MTEKEECLRLINNLLDRHKEHPKILSVLKGLRKRVQLIGASGGPLLEQPEMPYANSTNDHADIHHIPTT